MELAEKQQNKADHRFENACGRGQRIIALIDPVAQNEDVRCFGILQVHRILEQILRFKPELQRVAYVHDQKHESPASCQERNMPHAPKSARSIHLGRFIKRRIDHRDRGQIYDRVPTEVFPYIDDSP